MPLVLMECIETIFSSYLLIDDELGSATDRSSPCLQGRLRQCSPWSGTTTLELSYRFYIGQKRRQKTKNGNFELSWISRRDRVGFSNCLDLHMHYCATVSASNFQVQICSAWWDSTSRSILMQLDLHAVCWKSKVLFSLSVRSKEKSPSPPLGQKRLQFPIGSN